MDPNIVSMFLSRCPQLVVVTLMLCVMSAPTFAQTIGPRAGVSIDPEQFYFGAHVETPPLVDRLRFRPNMDNFKRGVPQTVERALIASSVRQTVPPLHVD